MQCTTGNFYDKLGTICQTLLFWKFKAYSSDKKGEIIVRDMTKFNDNNFLNYINI